MSETIFKIKALKKNFGDREVVSVCMKNNVLKAIVK